MEAIFERVVRFGSQHPFVGWMAIVGIICMSAAIVAFRHRKRKVKWLYKK